MYAKIEIRDPIAIYVLGEKFRVLHDFSTDRESLRKAVEGFKPERSMPLFGSNTPTPPLPGGSPQTNEAVRQSFREMRAFSIRGRARTTMDVFKELAKQLRRVPGRKSVVWISDAFPAHVLRESKPPQLETLVLPDALRRLNLADVAFYPVHARGLVTRLVNPRGGPSSTSLVEEFPTLGEVAEETGGGAVYNRNDVGEAIHAAIEDGQVTYTIGFYSSREKPDGNFHTLKLKVERHGLDVRHRAGYFDVETKPNENGARDESKIGMVAAVARSGENFQVAVQVDLKDLVLQSRDGKWQGSAELAFLSDAADGRTLEMANKQLRFDMTDEAYRARQPEGFALEPFIPARQDPSRIRA